MRKRFKYDKPITPTISTVLKCILLTFIVLSITSCYSWWVGEKNTNWGGKNPQIDTTRRQKIYSDLKRGSKDWVDAAHEYYGDTYDDKLPDLIVSIDSLNEISASLIQRSDSQSVLYGENKFWVLIISKIQYPVVRRDTVSLPQKIVVTSDKSTLHHVKDVNTADSVYVKYDTTTTTEKDVSPPYSLQVSREVLYYSRGPRELSISNIIGGILAIFKVNIAPSDNSSKAPSDSVVFVNLQPLGNEKDSSKLKYPLYGINAGINLFPDTYNRVAIHSSDTTKYSYNFNFINTESILFNTSIGVGLTLWGVQDSLVHRPSFLFLGNINLWHSHAPIDSRSLSLSFGISPTSLDDIFSKLFLGGRVSLGYFENVIGRATEGKTKYEYSDHTSILGESGLIFGIVTGHRIKPLVLIGIDFRL